MGGFHICDCLATYLKYARKGTRQLYEKIGIMPTENKLFVNKNKQHHAFSHIMTILLFSESVVANK